MKRPLVALELAPELIETVDNGEKQNTIREGIRDYQVGDRLVLACYQSDFSWCSSIKTITKVSHVRIGDVEKEDYMHQNWHDRVEMLEDLKRFYPNLTMHSWVTVIWWNT